MTESMKFGPEWLRNLSGDSSSSGTGGRVTASLTTPRYQLAEHRYGREEMLALFDRNYKPREPLISFSTLYVEKTQLPLALIQMTEDETRMWNGGITNIGGRGRGGSVDRGGRGRIGRGSLYSSHYSRGVGFDDSGDGPRIDSQSFSGRSRPFDRSQSERGWSERNGVSDLSDWNGSTSPRKELSRGTSSSLIDGNWRRHRSGCEDDDGWRKWGRSSWREGGSVDRERLDRNEGELEEMRSSGRWEHRGSHRPSHESGHHPPPRTARTWESNHHDNHDNLPEWATENPSESGGSFDASGAFHGGMYSDEEDDGVTSTGGSQGPRTRRVSEGNTSSTMKTNSRPIGYSSSQGSTLSRQPSGTTTGTINKDRPKSLHSLHDKDDLVDKERRSSSPSNQLLQTADTAPAKTAPQFSSDTPQKRTVPAEAVEKVENDKPLSNELASNKSPTKTSIAKEEEHPDKPDALSVKRQAPLQTEQVKELHDLGNNSVRQKTDDDLDRMKEEADALVAKLMADEESHREKTAASVPPSLSNQPSPVASANTQEKWFYRDPQGEVQGPFLASEMAEWCKSGYFTAGLMVRRTCDERYTTLGELIKMCGRVPFTPGPSIPPLKLSEQVIPPVPSTVPAGITASALPKTGIEDPLLLLQFQHMRLLQNQQFLLRQMRSSAIAKLSQSEHWSTLSPVEQNQLILQYVIQDSEIPEVPISTNPFVPHLASQATNPVMQLFTQMQQAKTQPEAHLASNQHSTTPAHPPSVDPIQQLIQQMGGMQNIASTVPQTNIASASVASSTQDDNPIKSLLRQLNVNANGHPQPSHIDTVWPQPPPQVTPQFNAQSWLAQVGPIPAIPPGQLPASLWELHAKDMKTEQQILEEQNLRLQEDRKNDELRKQEELQRQAEEETAKRKKEEQARQAAEEAKRKDEERKQKEEEKKRKEEEKRKQEEELKKKEEQKKKEEKKRKEEEKKREEKRKQEEENNKKKQEEEKKKKEEELKKKQEEKIKKEEEKKKKLEEQLKKQEEERQRYEAKKAEAQKRLEAEEQARRAEQRRREAEALRKLQERSKAPWAQAPRAPAPAVHASLAEIQKLEREKKAEEQRFQQLMQQQLAQQKEVEAVQDSSATDSSRRLQFKWAETATAASKPLQVKSVAQIQQEEQERIAKVKQQERERQEKAGHKESASILQNAGIWGAASQCLNWANSSSSSNNQVWSNNSGTASGFWDDPTPVIKSSTNMKQQSKPSTIVKTAVSANQQQQQQQQHQQSNKASKSKNKREEELVKKLFGQNTAKTDEFTQWCTKALTGIQASVDIPTFVGFLRDIESAYEVKEYVRVYLGDSKQSSEFAKQFLEKRSKWRSAQRPQIEADDLCKPAPAVNPNAPAEFQEVKGKSKKPKKGKMFKVDSRILGFSVSAAPDRINVGDRDYGEGV